jgi:hypothetical protein
MRHGWVAFSICHSDPELAEGEESPHFAYVCFPFVILAQNRGPRPALLAGVEARISVLALASFVCHSRRESAFVVSCLGIWFEALRE